MNCSRSLRPSLIQDSDPSPAMLLANQRLIAELRADGLSNRHFDVLSRCFNPPPPFDNDNN